MERKTYEINGVKYYQEELTLDRDTEISVLLDSVNISELGELAEMTVSGILNLLLQKGVLKKLFAIILIPESNDEEGITAESFGKVTNSTAVRIIEDFFTLNRDVITLFRNLLSTSAGMNTTPISPNTSVNQKQSLSTSKGKKKH